MPTLLELPQVDQTALGELVASETTVLTVNNRLARRLIQDFAQQQTERGQQVAETPAVVPWSGWLAQELARSAFHEGLPEYGLLLDSFATQLIWAEVIEKQEEHHILFDVAQAAAGAMQADQLIDEWHIRVDDAQATQEFQSFERWHDAYRSRLHALDALDPNLAVTRLIQCIEAGLTLPAHIVLAGFTELSPRMHRLVQALLARQVRVSVFNQALRRPEVLLRVMPADAGAEWEAAAHWARRALENNPSGRFAIIAANLDTQVPYARRVLSRVLGADSGTPAWSYNVAVARPLADWQAGRAALAWLRTFVLMKEQQGAAPCDLSAALLAGHCVGHEAERGARAMIDVFWRQHFVNHVSLANWGQSLAPLEQLSPAWQRAWQDWQRLPLRAPLEVWSACFRTSLSILGFPGRAQQSSASYQVVEALDVMFERFEGLSAVLGISTASEALKVLGRLARTTLFQPQRAADARLDVLGVLEAEGGRWDGVWLLGLTDEVLPAIARPNPFIPLAAQRQAQAPRATPERERQWAEQIFSNLCGTAPEVVLSSAMLEGERALRPSPLIVPVELSADCWSSVASAFVTPEFECLRDERGPEVARHERLTGGIGLLETQARNPLWAFIRHRLGVRGLPAYSELAYKMHRGTFLHAMMQQLWEELRDQETLHKALERQTLDDQIKRIAHEAGAKELYAFDDTLRSLEIERGIEVVRNWLMLEAQRKPFKVVEIEQRRTLLIKGLSLDLRLDRLDAVGEAADLLIIDYKTGASLPNILSDWSGMRPVNLQVPAYATMLGQEANPGQQTDQQGMPAIAGMLLVQLHTKGVMTAGLLAGDELGIEGPSTLAKADYRDATWPALLERLRATIETLAQEFVSGLAVNQSWHRQDLDHCDVLPLLRLYEDGQNDE